MNVRDNLGLVLTGGGARGAYQAGVLLGIAEITGSHRLPFSILAGTSAGSINAAFLASHADDFQGATRALCDLWSTLSAGDVFRTDIASLSAKGAHWLRDLALGGWIGGGHAESLLDTTPLRRLLERNFDPLAVAKAIGQGQLRALAITATNYHTGVAVTFIQGAEDVAGWTRTSRLGVRATIGVDHVLASSAIPVFFPSVAIGGAHYADGGIRMGTPFSPVIHLGADRILAVGIRSRAHEPDPLDLHHEKSPLAAPTHADVGGTLLNAVFLDAVDSDFERLERINRTIAILAPELRATQTLRPIGATLLLPSEDLGRVAAKVHSHLPVLLKHLLAGLGVDARSGWDLLSYLAFDSAYTARLVAMGYEDALRQNATIRSFFAG
jgi:NTE family protein